MTEQEAAQWCVQQSPFLMWLIDMKNFNTIFWIGMAELILHLGVAWLVIDWLVFRLPVKLWSFGQWCVTSWRTFMVDVKGGPE